MVTNSYDSERILFCLEQLQTTWKFVEGGDRLPTTEEIVDVIAGLKDLLDVDPKSNVALIEDILLVRDKKNMAVYVKVGVVE